MDSSIPVYEIPLPEYTLEQETDWLAVGGKLDRVIETRFRGRRIAIRGIGLIDHPGWSLDDLVSTILKLGTDKYDPQRKGIHEDFYRPFTVDLFAAPGVVADRLRSLRSKDDPSASVMATILELFCTGALADRGYSIRIDILMIYDLDQLEPVPMKWTPQGVVPAAPPPREESCDFTFKYPDQKQKALQGVIKILR